MTEPTPQPQAGTPPEGQPAATPEQNVDSLPSWAREAITKANREAANYRTQVQELKPLADQGKEYAEAAKRMEEAQKSETQRLTEQLEAQRRENESVAAEALRNRVALTHGISADDLDLLGSGTEEQITARAQRIAALKGAAAQPPAPTPPPTANAAALTPGATPQGPPDQDDALWAQYAPAFGAKQQ